MVSHSLLANLLRSKLGKVLANCRKRMTMKKRSTCMLIIRRKSHEKVANTRTIPVGIKGSCIGRIGPGMLELGQVIP